VTVAAILLGAALSTLGSLDVLEPSIRVESRAGTVPDTVVPPGKFVLALVTPSLSLRSTHEDGEASALVSSRLLLREPSPAHTSGFLLMHRLGLAHRKQWLPRWLTTFNLQGSYGEDDFTTFQDTFQDGSTTPTAAPAGTTSPGGRARAGTTTPQNPTRPASLAMKYVGATLEVGYQLSRISGIGLRLGSAYRDALNTQSDQARTPLSQQWTGNANLAYRTDLARRRRLKIAVDEAYVHVQDLVDTLVTQTTIAWQEGVGRDHTVTLELGANYVENLRLNEVTQPAGLLPIALIGWDGTLSRERDRQIQMSASTGVDWGFDPIQGVGSTRIPTTLSLQYQVGNRLGIGGALGYITTVSQSGRQGTVTNQTLFSASLPVTYQGSKGWRIESGARMSLTGPKLATPAELSGLELWAYAAVTATGQYRVGAP
jgi:hypothetical protein